MKYDEVQGNQEACLDEFHRWTKCMDEEKRLRKQEEKEERRQRWKREKEKIRGLHGTARLQYLWDYYRFLIVVLLAVVFVVAVVSQSLKGMSTQSLLHVAALSVDPAADSEAMADDFASYIGGLQKNQSIDFDLSMAIVPGTDTQLEQVSEVKLQVKVSSGTADLILANEDALAYVQRAGFLKSLDGLLTEERARELEQAGDLIYAAPVQPGQAASEAQREQASADAGSGGQSLTLSQALNNETEGVSYKREAVDLSYLHEEREEGDEIFAVRVDDSKVLARYAWYPANEKIYLAVIGNCGNDEMAMRYLDFLKGVQHE